MCDAKPGKRCAGHVKEDLAAAMAALNDAKDSGDDAVMDRALTRAEDLHWDYDCTRTGQRELSETLTKPRTSETKKAEIRRRLDRAALMNSARSAAVDNMPPATADPSERAAVADQWHNHVYLLRRQQETVDRGDPDEIAAAEKVVARHQTGIDATYAANGWAKPDANRPGDRSTPFGMCRRCGAMGGSAHRCALRVPPAVAARTPEGWQNADLDTRNVAAAAMAVHGYRQCDQCGQFTGPGGHQCPGERVMSSVTDDNLHALTTTNADTGDVGEEGEGAGTVVDGDTAGAQWTKVDPATGAPMTLSADEQARFAAAAAATDPGDAMATDTGSGQPPHDPELAAQAPPQIDERLADLAHERNTAIAAHSNGVDRIHYALGDQRPTERGRLRDWEEPMEFTIERGRTALEESDRRPRELADALAMVDAAQATIDDTDEKMRPLDAEYERRGRWPRAYLVVSSEGGHVHTNRHCGTLRHTTQVSWLTDYSGSSEEEIVDAAGERTCTVCVPSAPVSKLQQPTRMFSQEEKEAEERRAERAAAKSDRDRKRIDASVRRDGEPFTVTVPDLSGRTSSETFKTVTAAQQWYVTELSHPQIANELNDEPDRVARTQQIADLSADARGELLTALAERDGRTVADVKAELDKKVQAKTKRVVSQVRKNDKAMRDQRRSQLENGLRDPAQTNDFTTREFNQYVAELAELNNITPAEQRRRIDTDPAPNQTS